jgi:hypothetical protein
MKIEEHKGDENTKGTYSFVFPVSALLAMPLLLALLPLAPPWQSTKEYVPFVLSTGKKRGQTNRPCPFISSSAMVRRLPIDKQLIAG